jgi:hypothetical protein
MFALLFLLWPWRGDRRRLPWLQNLGRTLSRLSSRLWPERQNGMSFGFRVDDGNALRSNRHSFFAAQRQLERLFGRRPGSRRSRCSLFDPRPRLLFDFSRRHIDDGRSRRLHWLDWN